MLEEGRFVQVGNDLMEEEGDRNMMLTEEYDNLSGQVPHYLPINQHTFLSSDFPHYCISLSECQPVVN